MLASVGQYAHSRVTPSPTSRAMRGRVVPGGPLGADFASGVVGRGGSGTEKDNVPSPVLDGRAGRGARQGLAVWASLGGKLDASAGKGIHTALAETWGRNG